MIPLLNASERTVRRYTLTAQGERGGTHTTAQVLMRIEDTNAKADDPSGRSGERMLHTWSHDPLRAEAPPVIGETFGQLADVIEYDGRLWGVDRTQHTPGPLGSIYQAWAFIATANHSASL